MEERNGTGKPGGTIRGREGLFGCGGIELEFDCTFAKPLKIVFSGKNENERRDRLRLRWRMGGMEAEGRSPRHGVG